MLLETLQGALISFLSSKCQSAWQVSMCFVSDIFKIPSPLGFKASRQSSPLFIRNRAAIHRNVRTTAIYIFFVRQAVCPRVLERRYPSSRKSVVLVFSYGTSAGSGTIAATDRVGQCFCLILSYRRTKHEQEQRKVWNA